MTRSVNRIRRILVAIDFSAYSNGTLKYANEVSQITGAQLIAINIINQREINAAKERINSIPSNEFTFATYLPKVIGCRKLEFEGLLAGCGFKKSPSIKLIVDYGIPFEKILQNVEKEDVDLLVIGPKGRTNRHIFFFGDVAEKLFRHSPIPVMSLRFLPR